MLDRAEAAQILEIVDVDMPVVDLVAALPQQIPDHVLARPLGAADGGDPTKSLVVASCASKPASTASRIFRWISLTFIASLFPFCAASQRPRRLDQTILCRELQRPQIAFRIEPASIHSRRNV